MKKLKKSFEDCLKGNHSPIGVLGINKNDLVNSQSDGQGFTQLGKLLPLSLVIAAE